MSAFREVVNGQVTRDTHDSPENQNERTMRSSAAAALDTNRVFLAIASPTAAQSTAQVKALTRQMNALIRLTLQQLDATD